MIYICLRDETLRVWFENCSLIQEFTRIFINRINLYYFQHHSVLRGKSNIYSDKGDICGLGIKILTKIVLKRQLFQRLYTFKKILVLS